MGLTEEYRRQLRWRDWARVLDALPPLAGATVIDLGCGPGDVAALLAARGARVLGVDGNPELLAAARERGIETFERDLRDPAALDALPQADGLWCSFVAAYLPEPERALEAWRRRVRPDGWIALIEIDDLFAHQPLDAAARAAFESYADDARAAGRYDFRRGRELSSLLARSGFEVRREADLEDRELAFDGPADPAVLEAWRARLDRMHLLRDGFGAGFEAIRDALLACLARPDHRALARVVACIAVRPEER